MVERREHLRFALEPREPQPSCARQAQHLDGDSRFSSVSRAR